MSLLLRGIKVSAFLLASGVGIWFLVQGMSENANGQAKTLGISATDYANGNKRARAAAKKVTPSLKADFKEKGLTWGSPVFLRAFKEENVLELWVKKGKTFTLFRSYPIAAASGKLGPKLAEGDMQVPEGFYFVSSGKMNPASNFHLSFNIGYPNRYDRAHGRTGSFIMVHGSVYSIGCLAMTDAKIEEIYTLCDAALKGGQKFFRVHCFPFRMTKQRMAAAASNKWISFWNEIEPGYRWFEEKKTPPNVSAKAKRYHFQ